MDDGAARRCAQGLDISVVGTLGVLGVAKRIRQLETVRPSLRILNERVFTSVRISSITCYGWLGWGSMMLRYDQSRNRSKHFPPIAIHESLVDTTQNTLFLSPNSLAMNLNTLRQAAHHILLSGTVLATALFLAGCSGDDSQSGSSTQQSTPSAQQQQGPSGQMGPSSQTLSSSDVSEKQIQMAARIASSVQMGVQKDRMKMQRDMKEKYGNPQQMDSTQKAQARKEMRRRQMKMRKKQMRIMQEEAKNEGMNPQMFRQIMRSARQDSTLKRRLQTAMKAQMKKQMKEQMQNQMQQQGGQPNQ